MSYRTLLFYICCPLNVKKNIVNVAARSKCTLQHITEHDGVNRWMQFMIILNYLSIKRYELAFISCVHSNRCYKLKEEMFVDYSRFSMIHMRLRKYFCIFNIISLPFLFFFFLVQYEKCLKARNVWYDILRRTQKRTNRNERSIYNIIALKCGYVWIKLSRDLSKNLKILNI